MMTHKVIFQPSGRRGHFEEQKILLDIAKELSVPIESVCGGEQWCAKCKVVIEEGMENLTPLTVIERKLLSDREIALNYRLACCCTISGDVVASIPEVSRAQVQVVRKAIREIPVELDPEVKKYYVKMKSPTLKDSEGDLARLLNALKEQHGIGNLNVDYHVLKELPVVLRKEEWKVTVTVWGGDELIRIQPGQAMEAYGLAIDIGTTTMVGYLTNLSSGKVVSVDSMMNPQVSYGEDVMSRITYTITHPDGLEKLNRKVRDAVNLILLNTVRDAGVTFDDIYEIVLVGNTCMHHLFLKIPPEYLGRSPFPPAVNQSVNVKARDLGLKMFEAGNIHLLPNEAGFVGADNVGVLLATEPWKHPDIQLIIDIGTNGELVLGNEKALISTSCATGPAFEGAHIKHGMRAASGAIERIRIDTSTLEVQYKTIGSEKPRGICGSGIIEAVAEMFKAGIILKNGNLNKGINSSRLRKGNDGYEYILAYKSETSIETDIVLTQSDIRAIQLAKGAMYAGAKILMKNLQVTELNRVILAGAFGSYIDREAAMLIGLFPDCNLNRIVAVGNAAGDGARLALLNREKRTEAQQVARQVRYIELTVDPSFEKEFIMAMHFPHMKDSFPHLDHIFQHS